MALFGLTISGLNPMKTSSVAKSAVEDKGNEVAMEEKAIEEMRCFFLAVFPALYSPVPQSRIFVPNFAIRHDNFEVSAFISNPAAAHRTPSAPHWPPSPMYLRISGRDP